MSKFMPKSVPGDFDPSSVLGHTHLFSSASSLTQVSDNVGQLDPNMLSSYTAINETTAFFKFMTNLISEIDTNTFTINPNSPQHEYIIKYLMISTFILTSGFDEGINCEVSYLRIDEDLCSPFRNSGKYKGEKYFKEILSSWAEYLDPGLISFDSNAITPIRMLRVVKINGVPVAYYTSHSDRVSFYPFNTIISNESAVASLTGVSVNSSTNEWIFDYDHFRGNVLTRLSVNQKSILAAVFQSYANIPKDGNGFRLLMRELELKVPVGINPLTGTGSNGGLFPVRITSYTNPKSNLLIQDFPNENKLDDLLRVPYERRESGDSDSIFHALGYTLPRYRVFTRNGTAWLMVAKVADNISFIHCKGEERQKVTPEGIKWNQDPTLPVILDIEYSDINDRTVNLGSYTLEPGSDDRDDRLFTWDEANLQLICACIPPRTINPFLDKYWNIPEVMPITKECIELLEENHCSITDYTATKDRVSFKIVSEKGVKLETVSRNYTEADLVPSELKDDMNTIYTIMPRLSIFPYCRFTYNSVSVWNKYYFTAIAEDADSYLFFRTIKLQYRSAEEVGYKDMEFIKKSLLDSDKKTFIAYRCYMTFIPQQIFIEDDSGNELGVIAVVAPKSIALDPNKKAIMGVDMGSRNSIVAYYQDSSKNEPLYIYNYADLIYDVCGSYTPMVAEEWDELLNLHGLSGGLVQNTFTSAVLDYMDDDAPDRVDPMVHGRIIADLSESSFKKIIRKAEQIVTPIDDNNKLGEIGYHSNFKRTLWDSNDIEGVAPHVALFVKNLCYRLLLNAFMQRCGKIELRYTAPNDKVGSILKQHWTDALELAKEEFDIPDSLFTNLSVANYKLESVALYHHVKNNPKSLPYRYSVIIDGGDSTFDVSMIVKDPSGTPHLCQKFSIKYAGYNLLVRSIIDVAMKKKYTVADFQSMWIPKSGLKDRNKDESAIADLMKAILVNGEINWESTKSVEDVVYKLIEKNPIGLCTTSSKAKDVISLVELKYLLLLNAIIQTCIDSIPDQNSDQPVSVFLYGGANNIAKMLYSSSPTEVEKELGAKMTEWLQRYENSSHTPSIDLKYKVNPSKTELVKGLVQSDSITSNNDVAAQDMKPIAFTQDIYDGIIKGVFGSNMPPEFMDGEKCILDIPNISSRAELIGDSPEVILTQCRAMISGALEEKVDIPNRTVYPLAAMLYAIWKFETTIHPDEDN